MLQRCSNEAFNHIIYNLKPKMYEITLAIVKREMNDPNYVKKFK
jgi:hypothetical protein